MTGDQLEQEFRERGLTRGGILLLAPAEALELVHRARENGIRVLGVDGFIADEHSTQPSLELSVDLGRGPAGSVSDIWERAASFLRQYEGTGYHFEVVLE